MYDYKYSASTIWLLITDEDTFKKIYTTDTVYLANLGGQVNFGFWNRLWYLRHIITHFDSDRYYMKWNSMPQSKGSEWDDTVIEWEIITNDDSKETCSIKLTHSNWPMNALFFSEQNTYWGYILG